MRKLKHDPEKWMPVFRKDQAQAKVRFVDLKVWTDQRCALGRETESGRFYMSIPVSNRQADYEEYYEIDRDAFERLSQDAEAAAVFAARCRRRELDHLLIVPPGRDRGA